MLKNELALAGEYLLVVETSYDASFLLTFPLTNILALVCLGGVIMVRKRRSYCHIQTLTKT